METLSHRIILVPNRWAELTHSHPSGFLSGGVLDVIIFALVGDATLKEPLTFGFVSSGRAAWITKSSGSDIRITESSTQAITDFLSLQAPLQKHLNHCLSVLFPEVSLEVDEQLRRGTFSRGTELGQITELSFGAREQMGLISRLA